MKNLARLAKSVARYVFVFTLLTPLLCKGADSECLIVKFKGQSTCKAGMLLVDSNNKILCDDYILRNGYFFSSESELNFWLKKFNKDMGRVSSIDNKLSLFESYSNDELRVFKESVALAKSPKEGLPEKGDYGDWQVIKFKYQKESTAGLVIPQINVFLDNDILLKRGWFVRDLKKHLDQLNQDDKFIPLDAFMIDRLDIDKYFESILSIDASKVGDPSSQILTSDPSNTEQGGPKTSFGKVEPEKKD